MDQGNILSFFASTDESLTSVKIYLKMVYPTGTVSKKKGGTSSGTVDEFEIFSATFSPTITMSDKKRNSHILAAEFNPTSSPLLHNTKGLDCKTIWMKTYFFGNREAQSKLEALNFVITIQHNIGNTKKISVNENPASAAAVDNSSDANSHRVAAQMNTSQFLFSPTVSDIKIYCGDKEYPAHRIILANKSSVFLAMFSTKMEENITGKLTIGDATPGVVEEFLRFIYTGSVKIMEENAPGIFSMAVKYDVKDLKTISENYLLRSVSIVNVLERYTLGKLLSSDAMVKKSVEIMKAKRGEIWKTKVKFFEDCKKFPELFSIVFP